MRVLLEGILIALFLALDQASKALARAHLPYGESRTLLPGLLGLRYSENTGAAFSSFSGKSGFLIALTACLVIALAVYLLTHRQEPRRIRIPLVMILSGGLGNLIDRMLFSSVTDFFELLFVRFAIFNVADVLITVGAALLAISVIFYGGLHGAK